MDDLHESQQLFKEAIDASREQRQQIEEDLRFSDPSNPDQWDDTVRRSRELDPGGARPCLVMDHTGQYVANVAGQITKSPPSIHVVPVDSGADVKVAEHLDGVIRHVEYSSRAATHYGIAATSAARTGIGYLVVRPEIINAALGYQEPRISSVADPLRVVFDPWSIELDGSDADYAWVLSTVSIKEFKRRYGDKAEAVSFGEDQRTRGSDANRKSVVIAEEWYKEDKTRHMLVWSDFNGEDQYGEESEYWQACQEAGQKLFVLHSYKDKYQCVKWRTMSGAAILDTPKNQDGSDALYPADTIGVVPVYGYWGVSEGRIKYCGIPRRGRSAQWAYNYHVSEQLAFMGTSPKSPWIGSARAFSGFESLWDRASIESKAFLPYNDQGDDGSVIPMPQRMPVGVNLQNHLAGADQALRDLEAAIGMYQANLGAPSNETSGVAIDSRKEQGEASTAVFPQNLSASLAQVGRICMQMIPKLLDTKRVQRIMGLDGSPSHVTVDPGQKAAIDHNESGAIINPGVGTYDVRVVVGASYSTQRSQAQAAIGEIMRNNPDLTAALAPIWAGSLDIPNAEKVAQVLTAMAPPAVQAILNPNQGAQNPDQLKQQLQQAQEALKEAIQHAQEAQADADKAMEDASAKHEELEQRSRELDIKAFDAETKRLQVTSAVMTPEEIRLMVAQTIDVMLSHPMPLPSEDDGHGDQYEMPAEDIPEQDIQLEPEPQEQMPPFDDGGEQEQPLDPLDEGLSTSEPQGV